MKRLNYAFVLLIAVLAFSPILVFANKSLNVGLPEWVDPSTAKYLSGSSDDYSEFAALATLEHFLDREFQDAAETAIDAHIPCKPSVLLSNAALQGSLINTAAIPFGYECRPTFFGSEQLYLPRYNAVTQLPTKMYDGALFAFQDFSSALSQIALRHPDKRFVVFIPWVSETSNVNPVVDVSPSPINVNEAMYIFEDKKNSEATNLFFVTTSYDNPDDYYQDYFRTDHHWNYQGTINAYNEIANTLGLEEFVSPGEISFGSYLYLGSYGRKGLCNAPEPVFDTSFDFSSLKVIDMNGETRPFDHSAFEIYPDEGKPYSFYDVYMDVVGNGETLFNENGTGSALVVSDSYGGSLLRHLGLHYHTVHNVRHLTGNDSSGMADYKHFDELVSRSNYDDIFFVAHLNDIRYLMNNYPNYFD